MNPEKKISTLVHKNQSEKVCQETIFIRIIQLCMQFSKYADRTHQFKIALKLTQILIYFLWIVEVIFQSFLKIGRFSCWPTKLQANITVSILPEELFTRFIGIHIYQFIFINRKLKFRLNGNRVL